jgi:hypothetical protein
MPVIVNGYAGNEKISDAMRSLADSLFGDEAKQALIRENVAKTRLEEERLRAQNENAQRAGDLYQAGDYRGANAAIIRHTPTASNLGSINLAGAGLDANGNFNDPRLTTAALGAGHSFEGTVPGQNATIAERIGIAKMQADRAAATQQAIAERNAATQDAIARRQQEADERKNQNTPITVYRTGPTGQVMPTIVRQSVAYGQPGKPLSKDEVTGLYLSGALDPRTSPSFNTPSGTLSNGTTFDQSENQPSSVADRINAANGGRDPFQNLTNDTRHLLGLPSYSAEQNLQNARDDLARTTIPDLPPRPLVDQTQPGKDVYDYGGLWPVAKNLFGGTMNQIGINAIPDQSAAIENIANLAARTRALPISGVSRDSVQREKWNSANIPQPHFGVLGEGGYLEQQKLAALTGRLRDTYSTMRRQAMDPATPPAERAQLVGQLNELRDVIAGWEAPLNGNHQPGAATTSTAPGQGTVHQVPQVDKAQVQAPSRSQQTIPRAAIEALRRNPRLSGEFDDKYGYGASFQVLGGM